MKYLIILTLAVLALSGCGLGFSRYKATLPVNLSSPGEGITSLEAETGNGYVTVTTTAAPAEAGARAEAATAKDITVDATVVAYARTSERAAALSRETSVTLESSGGQAVIAVVKPKTGFGESVKVSLDINLPPEIALDLVTSNGAVSVTGTTAPVVAGTSNGKIALEDLSGGARVKTSNGSVAASRVVGLDAHTSNGTIKSLEASGDTRAETSNGSVTVEYAETASAAPSIYLRTSNGSVNVRAPKDFSAKADLSTSNGRIDCQLPITDPSRAKRSLAGTIGGGEGRLEVHTSNGSITIR